jgi:protein tyrosine phosphatase (PTP) superfamily phosphohydrolase (DUF442 family)
MRVLRLIALALCCLIARSRADESSPKRIPSKQIENLHKLSPRVFSGGNPEGRDAFAQLRELGVTAIISVDGSKPNVEAARQHGLRYIHLPIGYDGAARSNVFRLVKAAQTTPGAVFVHCHHGKHRGPAAAAVICQATENWTTNRATRWLKAAGTSPDYPGLFGMVTEFRAPTAAELSAIRANFPEQATVTGLIDGMVEVDLRWEHLKASQAAGFRAPANHPDLVPAREAALLAEAFREMARGPDAAKLGADFQDRLQTAEREAWDLHALLKDQPAFSPEARARADLFLAAAGRGCASCHKKYRNARAE